MPRSNCRSIKLLDQIIKVTDRFVAQLIRSSINLDEMKFDFMVTAREAFNCCAFSTWRNPLIGLFTLSWWSNHKFGEGDEQLMKAN